MPILKCAMCGTEYQAQRKGGKYCSDACKMRYNRLPDTLDSELNNIRASVAKINTLVTDHPHLVTQAYESLHMLLRPPTQHVPNRPRHSVYPLTLTELVVKLSRSKHLQSKLPFND